MKVKCHVCKKDLDIKPSRYVRSKSKHIYCSPTCYHKSCLKLQICPVCGKKYPSSKNSKTCSRSCANKKRTGIKYQRGAKTLRERLIYNRGGKCQKCGFNNIKSLCVHHIIHRAKGGTNQMSNLLLLCANCHMEQHYGFQTFDVFKIEMLEKDNLLKLRREKKYCSICGKNIYNKSKTNMCQKCYCKVIGKPAKKVYRKELINYVLNCRYCNKTLGKRNTTGLCHKCSSKLRRKIKRPPINILLKEIKELGFLATGRKYGVSDNAIRKWLKSCK